MKAVIQAGGKGTRLRPYSLILPKPMMPVGDLPVIELLIKWLRRKGISEIFISTGYLGHLIQTLCGDGRQWGVEIRYSQESEPLGTMGPLNLLREHLDETFLVMNGDLITDLDLRAFTAFHASHAGLMTVAATHKEVHIDLGVIENDNGTVKGFREKPTMKFNVSMGIYCLEPAVLDYIPNGIPFGFDDLMYCMLDHSLPVHIFEHTGWWMDIGRPEDFLKAQETMGMTIPKILGI